MLLVSTVLRGSGGVAAPRYFSPGYGYRRRLVIPADAHRLTAADGAVVVAYARTLTWLKTVPNGGRVQSSAGNDIRFELPGGAKLPHHLVAYVPTTGRVEVWIRFPSAALGVNLACDCYHGNASAAAEQNVAGTWAGFVWSVGLHDGVDGSPSAANLTLTNVVATTLNGLSAGDIGA